MMTNSARKPIVAVDLFCGAGGLTHGFLQEGIDVRVGFDIDPSCKYPFEYNNASHFVLKDLKQLEAKEVCTFFNEGEYRVLAGCAPCQPFSTYTQGINTEKDEKWGLLYSFARLIEQIRPEIITMENVPKLAKHKIFSEFIDSLKKLKYHVTFTPNVKCVNYGIPQDRRRLVLFASIFGEIHLEPYTHNQNNCRTVRNTISHLPRISAGEKSLIDPLHYSSILTERNLTRIRASKPGGTWRDWDTDLQANCHKKPTGQSYPSVYGRMVWDKPSSTITTQSYSFGSGRFGHPEQDRALSLRECALLQTFPQTYSFAPPTGNISLKSVGRMIGNAVPVELARIIARSIIKHIEESTR